MEIKVIKGPDAVDSGLAEQIIAFDKQNMESILQAAGLEFPEQKRREGFKNNPTFIIAFDGAAIAGYLEYVRSWNDPNYLYISSVQIQKRFRNTALLLQLLDEFRRLVQSEDFIGIETNVQKTNTPAVKLYQKLGFTLEPNPRNNASWTARAGKEILRDSLIIPLIRRWRESRGHTAQ